MIRLVKKSDIPKLAIIYKDLYDNVDIGEDWSIEKSTELLNYWYDKQSDLFYVAEEDGKVLGACVSGIKSWFDGLRLTDGEIFVSKEAQGKHLAKSLMLEHLKQAKIKYNAKVMEFHTYGDETEFPQNWYNRIGFKKDNELIIMNGEIEDVLNNLGYVEDGKIMEEEQVINYSYQDLTNLYNSLKTGDTVYIFDMLPEYAYQDNEDEINYLNSRINAMKNGANVSLFIVGTKDEFDSLATNELFNNTISTTYGNSNIYLIDRDEIKDKCPLEYFQLADGLYLGIHEDGTKEVFRDLWTNNNLGLLIKDNQMVTFIESSVYNIVDKINNNEINCIENV